MIDQCDTVFRQPTQITIDQFRAIKNELLALCDRRHEFAARLEQDGFSAFRPMAEFQESFCSTPQELETHRIHSNELAKIYFSADLSSLLPFRDRETALNEHYVSPLIEKMLKDSPHVDRSNPHGAWSQCEPCNWRREQLRLEDVEAYERQFVSAKGLVADQFYSETANHKSGLGGRFSNSRSSRCKLFIAAAEKYGIDIGLVFSKEKAHRHLPTVVKSVNDSWDLRWMLETPRQFSTPLGVKRENNRHLHARFAPKLLICGSKQPSPLSVKIGEILDVNYYRFAPEFGWGYCDFFDNDELEVCVKASITLIGYVIDEVTSIIKSNLG